MKYVCLAIVMTSALVLRAAEPLGKITGSGPLTLNGKAVPATAASALPLVAGDEIATSDSSATIALADSSRARMGPHARVRLEVKDSSTVLRVLAGSVDLKRAKNSAVSLAGASSGPSATAAPSCRKPPPRSKHFPW